MILTCGYMTINSKTINSKEKKFSFSGQICVDGVETFLVYKQSIDSSIRYYPYGKREFKYEEVVEEYGDKLDALVEELVLEKSNTIKSDKKYLANLRKQDRQKNKVK